MKPDNAVIKRPVWAASKALFAALILMAGFGTPAGAAAGPAPLRVGLERKFKDAVRIGIDNPVIDIGFSNPENFVPAAELTAGAGFSVSPADGYFVSEGKAYPNYAAALSAAPPGAFPAYTQNGWAVYEGPFANQRDAGAAAAQAHGAVLNPAGHRTILYDGDKSAAVFDDPASPVLINGDEKHYISLGGAKYRGVIEFSRNNGRDAITPVNIIPLEQYLYSVVASEMPQAWPAEALKAQAVAARSYTLTRAGVHAGDGYDLCDAVHCQSYLGFSNEAPSTNLAVDQTAGIMAYYGGRPVNAVYFSSSGGVTVNSEDVWENAVPYLRSVPDSFQKEYNIWTRAFTFDDIQNCLKQSGYDIGAVTGVRIGSFSPGGYVTSLVIAGTAGVQTLTRAEIRSFFAPSADGSLNSVNFTMYGADKPGTPAPGGVSDPLYVLGSSGQAQPAPADISVMGGGGVASGASSVSVMGASGVCDYPRAGASQPPAASVNSPAPARMSPPASGTVIFYGEGKGHGVGMSQYGAKGMAEAGYTYQQILKHYYTGVEIR